ncbi:MAG: YggS family pyridoxal phosphate-dependent enzyme [Verrucomicrobia bacterium]|nr:YggS family pyridoxal phosphate-dependent enzyme [Verrucomicrobiota bacterium]
MPEEIEERLERVRAEIAEAAKKAGRRSEEIDLVAVSKGHPAEKVRCAMQAGQLLFGESKVQEARAKIPSLPAHARWHFIGHLQRNKVRQALPLFELIHSVDSYELAEQLSRAAMEAGMFPRVLLEVNVAGEATKFGFRPEQLTRYMKQLLEMERLEISGLMTIPPFVDEPEKARRYFEQLRRFRDTLEEEFGVKLPSLSMGMSGDFAVAIEEGATLVRVGTAIFGPRMKREFTGDAS